MNEDEAVRQFLGDRPAANELQDWRMTLEQRLRSLEADRDRMGATAAIDTKIAQLKKQIGALAQEEAVTQFVEDSVRVTLAMGAASDGTDFADVPDRQEQHRWS
jgi:phage shock protein A